MTKVLDCTAPPVPVVSVDIYEFDTLIGAHWDGPWTQPNPSEVEATGGFQYTPDDVDHWARQFACTGLPNEQLIPVDETDGGRRPITVLTVEGCKEPITAFGMPGAEEWGLDTPFKMERDVVAVLNPVLLDTFLTTLD